MTTLTDRQKAILTHVLPVNDGTGWIKRIEGEQLTMDEISSACDFLSNEFHMEGIDENFEATEYGKEVKHLLDVINAPRLKWNKS